MCQSTERVEPEINENKNLEHNTNFFFSRFKNFSLLNKSIDSLLALASFTQLIFGTISWFIYDKITSIAFTASGIFSGTTLSLLRKNRLQASVQQSADLLKEENDELKENNEELKENIDGLELVSQQLSEDLKMLKDTIGLFDQNSEDVLKNLREIYLSLKKENETHAKLNKNMIHINILQIIRHFDTSTTFSLTYEDLEQAKKTLLNAFPNLNYDLLLNKIKENNKITVKNIYESIRRL